MNTCIGSILSLNRIISIQPITEPYKYVIAHNFRVSVKTKPTKNVSKFLENSKFKIVEGKEGAGTVSFKLLNQTADKEYYLGHNYPKSSDVKVIDISPKNATAESRRRVSFKLENGLATNYKDKLSFRFEHR